MSITEMYYSSSPVFAVIIGLAIAACVVGIVWLAMMAAEKTAAEDRTTASPPEALRRMIDMAVAARPQKQKEEELQGTAADAGMDEDELVAVIAAAIAAYAAETGGSGLIIRRIRRITDPGTPWTMAARRDQMESRRV